MNDGWTMGKSTDALADNLREFLAMHDEAMADRERLREEIRTLREILQGGGREALDVFRAVDALLAPLPQAWRELSLGHGDDALAFLRGIPGAKLERSIHGDHAIDVATVWAGGGLTVRAQSSSQLTDEERMRAARTPDGLDTGAPL